MDPGIHKTHTIILFQGPSTSIARGFSNITGFRKSVSTFICIRHYSIYILYIVYRQYNLHTYHNISKLHVYVYIIYIINKDHTFIIQSYQSAGFPSVEKPCQCDHFHASEASGSSEWLQKPVENLATNSFRCKNWLEASNFGATPSGFQEVQSHRFPGVAVFLSNWSIPPFFLGGKKAFQNVANFVCRRKNLFQLPILTGKRRSMKPPWPSWQTESMDLVPWCWRIFKLNMMEKTHTPAVLKIGIRKRNFPSLDCCQVFCWEFLGPSPIFLLDRCFYRWITGDVGCNRIEFQQISGGREISKLFTSLQTCMTWGGWFDPKNWVEFSINSQEFFFKF